MTSRAITQGQCDLRQSLTGDALNGAIRAKILAGYGVEDCAFMFAPGLGRAQRVVQAMREEGTLARAFGK